MQGNHDARVVVIKYVYHFTCMSMRSLLLLEQHPKPTSHESNTSRLSSRRSAQRVAAHTRLA